MKILTATALICVVIVLTAALPEASKKKDDETEKTELTKRWFWHKCSSGWKLYKKRCFRFFPYRKSWVQAEKYCQTMGANLASVHNIPEYHKVQRLIQTQAGIYKRAWIGGSNAQEVGSWLWSDGTPFNYWNWCVGQPNNYGHKQRCLEMNFGGHRCWNDYGCFNRKAFVCAKKI